MQRMFTGLVSMYVILRIVIATLYGTEVKCITEVTEFAFSM